MWTKREILIFLAGAATLHTLSHVMLQFAAVLPLNFWGIIVTYSLNTYALIISALVTAALLWLISRTK